MGEKGENVVCISRACLAVLQGELASELIITFKLQPFTSAKLVAEIREQARQHSFEKMSNFQLNI